MVKIRNLAAISIAFGSLLVGCGKDTVGDVVNRERDRDREKAATVAQDFDKASGYYKGETVDSDVGLLVETSRVADENSTVPQPRLIGSLIFSPYILVGNTGERPRTPFQFSDGIFDKASGDLSFTIDKDGLATPVKCRMSNDGSTLSCRWYSRLYNKDFTVKRDSRDNARLTALQTAPTERYVGRALNTSITATFEAALSHTGESQLLQNMIVGKFVFLTDPITSPPSPELSGVRTEVPFLFYNGSFDVATGIISMSIAGDPQDILVNCKIMSRTQLKCKWHAREYAEFVLTKE